MRQALSTRSKREDPEPGPGGLLAREPSGKGIAARLFRLVPALGSLRAYSWHALTSDAVAGLTVAAVAVPQTMAYATVAGIPPRYGLYGAIVLTAVGALFDSCRQLVKGPTNAICIALLSALLWIPASDRVPAAVALALLVGLVQLGITLLRLGDLTRYISQAVIVGFTVGAACLLVLDQLKNLLGLTPQGEPGDHFLKRFWLTLAHGGEVHAWTVLLGAGTILLIVALGSLNRRLRRRGYFTVPEFLVPVAGMAALVWLCGLDRQGVQVIDTIPRALPAFQVPVLSWELVQRLSGSALTIAVLGLLESLAMAKAIVARTGQKLAIHQQCFSEGVANLAGSFFHCFPGSGSLTRSAINHHAGAASQWSAIFSAAAVAATVLLFAPLARYIPRAALAGLLMVTAGRMIDRRQLVYHLRATRFDAGIVVATALAAVFVSVEFCILIGVLLSFALYVPRAARIHLSELTVTPERVVRERVASDPPCGRLLLFNLEGELFFGSAPALDEHLAGIEARARDGIRVVVLRLKRVRNPDAVCLQLLDNFLKRLEARKVLVLLCGVRRDLGKALRSTGLEARLGPGRIFREAASVWSSTLDAVRHAYGLLGNDLCATCPRRDETDDGREPWYYMI